MNTITLQSATSKQFNDIRRYTHQYLNILAECVAETEEFGFPIVDRLKLILGHGVKCGVLAKYENLSKIVNDEISFDVWLKVNEGNPGLYYKIKMSINLVSKSVKAIEY